MGTPRKSTISFWREGGQQETVLIDNNSMSSWGEERKVWENVWGNWEEKGWNWAIKLSSPTLNGKRQHYGTFSCAPQLGFQTKSHSADIISQVITQNLFQLSTLFIINLKFQFLNKIYVNAFLFFSRFLTLISTFINMPITRMILGENSLQWEFYGNSISDKIITCSKPDSW